MFARCTLVLECRCCLHRRHVIFMLIFMLTHARTRAPARVPAVGDAPAPALASVMSCPCRAMFHAVSGGSSSMRGRTDILLREKNSLANSLRDTDDVLGSVSAEGDMGLAEHDVRCVSSGGWGGCASARMNRCNLDAWTLSFIVLLLPVMFYTPMFSQADAAHTFLRSNAAHFQSISKKVTSLSKRFPMVNNLIGKVQTHKQRDMIIMACVIATLMFFTLFYWSNKA